MRFWLSGPRLFNGLVRPGISFSSRELAAWGKRQPKVSADATLGICRRPDGAMMLAIPGKNGAAEHEPDGVLGWMAKALAGDLIAGMCA